MNQGLGSEAVASNEGRWRPRNGALLGLRGKMVLLYVAAVLLVVGSSVLLSLASLTEAFNREYREKALAIVRTFDAHYESIEEIRDSKVTQENIDRLMAMNPNIYKISLYVPEDGKVVRIASSDKNQIGEAAEEHDAEPIRTGRIIFNDKIKEGEDLVEVLAPLHADGKPVAALGVYMRLASRDEAVRNLAMRFATISIVSAILLLTVVYISMNWLLLKPISLLKRSARAIERGWLHTRIVLKRNDELGELAEAFNIMADALESRDKENQALQKRLREEFEQVQARAMTDPVTGLYNHLYFQDRLTKELAMAHRLETPVALLFGDIDHFKALNDTFGHQFGDRVLREMAYILRDTMREIDTVARYGGEEFAIILPGTDHLGGHQAGERIRRAVANYNFFGNNPNLHQAVTISIGVAAYPEDGDSREELIWKADRAMYYAKRLGRNQVRMYRELTELREIDADQIDQETLSEEIFLDIVHSLAAAVDARDYYDCSHSESVSRYAAAIARAMGIAGRQLRNIGIAGLLHDVGKIGIRNSILAKPGPLDEEEWRKMREHPFIGGRIVKRIVSLGQIIPLIAAHHENYDGSGYPYGTSGDGIPLGARIIAVADAYHAMISDRPYRRAKSHGEAIVELRRSAGTRFDPAVVEAFVTALEHDLTASARGTIRNNNGLSEKAIAEGE